MTLIAHLSDCHIPPLPRVKLKQLMSKRISGYLNWQLKRKHIHSKKTLDIVCSDMKKYEPDHIVVTGDLVNLGLPEEYTNSSKWLETIGEPNKVSVVPGNHDSYVKLDKKQGFMSWEKYMKSNSDEEGDFSGKSFPFIKYISEKIALIGLSSSIPTPVSMATGQLGERQLIQLKEALNKLAKQKVYRIVLIHHPPLLRQTSKRRCLIDGNDLEEVLRQEGAELVLHGHNHINSIDQLETKYGTLPIIGVSSASAKLAEKGDFACYNLIDINDDKSQFDFVMSLRGIREQDTGIVELAKYRKQDLIS